MDRFHKIHFFLSEKPPDGYTWSGGETDKKTKQPPGQTLCGQKCGNISQSIKTRKSGLSRNPKLDNARRLRGIYFIDPEDEQFKLTIKNAQRKLEIPMPAAMPCKTSLCRSSRETCRTVGEHKTKYACVVQAGESVRIRMEGSRNKNHEDHIAGEGVNSMTHYSLFHKFIPMTQAMKIPDAKAAVEKEWGKTRENTSMAADESQKQKGMIDEARNDGRKVHFASLMDLCHLKNSDYEPKIQKYKGRVVLRGDMVKDDSGSYAVFTGQDHQHHK